MDRNRSRFYGCVCCSPSPSARRAWIEITWHGAAQACHHVALRKEGVDRNNPRGAISHHRRPVALRKEGVDRNHVWQVHLQQRFVALRKEGVDRNRSTTALQESANWSPSARRAWIEITNEPHYIEKLPVALRKEGVDRNDFPVFAPPTSIGSPSARRAWIEMSWTSTPIPSQRSPSARRAWIEIMALRRTVAATGPPSTQRAWIEMMFLTWQIYSLLVAFHTDEL